MIEYSEILNKIQIISKDAINNFNNKVNIPLIFSNMNSKISKNNEEILIENNEEKIVLSFEDRKSYSEVLYFLKKIDSNLYTKIPFKFVDFFEKFKLADINVEDDNLEKLTLEILAIINIKFWCKDDSERKHFLKILSGENFEKNNKVCIKSKDEEKKIKTEENVTDISKLTFWNILLLKIRNWFKK